MQEAWLEANSYPWCPDIWWVISTAAVGHGFCFSLRTCLCERSACCKFRHGALLQQRVACAQKAACTEKLHVQCAATGAQMVA